MKKTIYFAHSRKLYFSEEEKEIENLLIEKGYEIINPRDFEIDEKDKKVVSFDFQKLKDADKVLCFFISGKCNTNVGTLCEMHWAKSLYKKLIIIADFYHPFLETFSDEYYISIENFKNNKRLIDINK